MATRYTAEWIVRQHNYEGADEWNPDADEREFKVYGTLATAKRYGIAASKKAGCVDWVRVAQEEARVFRDEDGRGLMWDEVRAWHGDWSGNWNEV